MVMTLNSKKDTLLPHCLTERLDVLGSVTHQQLLHLGVKVLPRLHQGTAVLAPIKTGEFSSNFCFLQISVLLDFRFELFQLNLKREKKIFCTYFPVKILFKKNIFKLADLIQIFRSLGPTAMHNNNKDV